VADNRYSGLTVTLVLLAVFMWASSFPLIKIGLEYFPPLGMAAIRYAIAAMFMLLLLHHRDGVAGALSEFRSDWKILTIAGLVGVALPNAALNVGLQYTTASLSAIIQASGPVYTVILAAIFLREAVGLDRVVGTVIAIIGSFLLVAQDGIDLSSASFVGNLFVLVSALSYAVSGIVCKVALRAHHPLTVTAWSLIVGSIMLFPFLPIESGIYTFSSEAVVVVLLLGIFPGCLAVLFYNYALSKHEVSSLAFFIYLIPVFAAILSALLLQEIITLPTAILGAVVILGVFIAQYRPIARIRARRERRERHEAEGT